MVTQRKTFPDLVTQNIPWLIGLAAAAYSGYVTGLTRIDRLEASDAKQGKWIACATRHFDYIESKAPPPPPCQLEAP